MYKLLDCVLNERLKKEIYGKEKKITREQTGFKKGIGCEMNILRMIENLRQLKREKGSKRLWSFYLDLKSAFDSVDHKIVFQKMKEKLAISNELIETIKWLYRQTKFQIGDQEIPIGTGVIQGGVLSPTIFVIMFDDLIKELGDKGYKVFAYADDLAVIGYGKNSLKEVIRICEEWTIRNNMKINREKSGIIWHKGR